MLDIDSMQSIRISKLPPYVFTIINRLKKEAISRGMDIIDMGMGSPDLPVPQQIRDELVRAMSEKHSNRYPAADGIIELKRAIAYWYGKRFNVDLNPSDEVLVLIGSKEGIGNMSAAFLNRDDYALVPSPTYPIFFNSVIIFGGMLYNLPLLPENDYLPDLNSIEPGVLRRSKLMYLSYPHNPTTVTVELEYFRDIVEFGREHQIIISHDAAYSELCFDGWRAPSFMQMEGAKDVGIEFHSLSKTFSMAGWRIAFVVGNSKILKVLARMKSYMDFGVFNAIQRAAITAMELHEDVVRETIDIYQRRRDVLCDGLTKLGWKHTRPKATMYVWLPIPEQFKEMDSLEFSSFLIKETGIAVAPGAGFGAIGNDHFRFALVEPEERILEALDRLSKL